MCKTVLLSVGHTKSLKVQGWIDRKGRRLWRNWTLLLPPALISAHAAAMATNLTVYV